MDSSGNEHHGTIHGATWVHVGAPIDYQKERAVAEWVISVGGHVVIVEKEAPIYRVSDLPADPFKVYTIALNDIDVTDDDLSRFSGLSELTFLYLGHWEARPSPITDELLETRSDLTGALPLFSEADPEVRIIASKTRIAHNHWVLGEIAEGFPDENGRQELALSAIDRLLSGPATVTTRGLAAALRVLTRNR